MKPPTFDYLCATSLDEAVTALAADEDAKVLAGGQSLMPLLNLRLARPSLLVDINRLDLARVFVDRGILHLGAMVRQRRLELDPVVARTAPLLAIAAAFVGHPATRNRGTIGGSLAHADPVAELPAVAVALGAAVVALGPSGSRKIACADLADGFMSTTLAPGEIITEVCVPVVDAASHGAAWCEWAPRVHDFPEAGIGVEVDLDDSGCCVAVRAAACCVGGQSLALGAILGATGLLGCSQISRALLCAIAQAVGAGCAAAGHPGQGELTGLLAARAVHQAMALAMHPGRLGAAG